MNKLPDLTMLFEGSSDSPQALSYLEIARHTLLKILPTALHTPESDPDLLIDQQEEFASLLPLFHATKCTQAPSNMTFYVLAKNRPNAFQFFFEMISHWLIPGKRLNVILLSATDVKIPFLGNEECTLCEIKVHIETQEDLNELQRNLPIIETEVCLGMQSIYYARRILEIKGLSADKKTSLIQEHIALLIARKPKVFDYDILTEMQHVLVMCKDEFKAARECRLLSRIISVHYLFRKTIREAVEIAPDKRHLSLKLFRTTISLPEGDKQVLGVLVGLNFIKDKEVFEERQLLSAIQNYVPSAHAVDQSFFFNRRGSENICTLYLEIEKTDGEQFTGDEITLLRQELPTDLKDRIEHLMHPIFMPRNEEEIMRNVLSLSNQIKFVHDLPQVIISFDQQSHAELFFTIILVRVMKPGCMSIQEMFVAGKSTLEYIHDRSKTVGYLRKKYAKEAVVFRVKLAKQQFLRRDNSIDLNKARQEVASELVNVVGDVRDFNGGLISKQNELLYAFRESLGDVKYNELLLENFFYSLTPDIMRTILDPQVLKSWFNQLLDSIDDGFFIGENYSVKIQIEPQQIYTMVKTEDRGLREVLNRKFSDFYDQSNKLACSFVSVYDVAYIGYLYMCDEPDEQQHFCQILQSTLASHTNASKNKAPRKINSL